MKKDKAKAAAIAAVMAYLQTEEEAILIAATQVTKERLRKSRPMGTPNYWGMAGRNDMMQMRNLMQMKAMK